MKTSILLPSLDADYLAELLPQIAGPDREIVVCSPSKPDSEDVVWVEDKELDGNNSANRMAFEASTGDVIVCLADDIIIVPGWIEEGLCHLETGDLIVSLAPQESSFCFGLLYANFPMASRKTVERHWDRFYPYRANWGDVAFSLSVWESEGKVVETSRRLVCFRGREGHPETPAKAEGFDQDCQLFLEDFGHLSRRWLRSNWRLFNHA
jgi:hypothetical protein